MFIRWKGRYAYLENRYTGEDGKVKSQSRYLGQNYLVALEKMLDSGEISKCQFKKLISYEPEGVLKPTGHGYLTINCESSCLLKNSRIAIFFNGKWLPGTVERDERDWYLKDDSGNIVGLRPGIRVRILL
jgi:hypothetical protein